MQYGEEVEATYVQTTQTGPGRENGNVINDTSFFSNHVYKKKKSPLRLGKKIYEFYNAPITKFWASTVCRVLPVLILFIKTTSIVKKKKCVSL